MDGLGWVVAVGSLALAIVALWWLKGLSRDFSQLKREYYYVAQQVKGFPKRLESTVEPLAVHLANLAEGKSVSGALVRSGKLFHEISGAEAAPLIANGVLGDQVCVLDVRTKEEYDKQRIPGAISLPVESLEKRYQADIPPQTEVLVVYCAGGDRSRLACDFLSRQGYGNVYFLRDGLVGWPGNLEGVGTQLLIQITSNPSKKIQPVT